MRRMLVALIEKQTGGDYSRENLKKVFLDWEKHIKTEASGGHEKSSRSVIQGGTPPGASGCMCDVID